MLNKHYAEAEILQSRSGGVFKAIVWTSIVMVSREQKREADCESRVAQTRHDLDLYHSLGRIRYN